MVEESFAFLEDNRVAVKPEHDEFSESVAEFMQRNKMKIDLPPLFQRPSNGSAGAAGSVAMAGVAGLSGHGQQQTPNTEFLSKELRTPEVQSLQNCFNCSFCIQIIINREVQTISSISSTERTINSRTWFGLTLTWRSHQ